MLFRVTARPFSPLASIGHISLRYASSARVVSAPGGECRGDAGMAEGQRGWRAVPDLLPPDLADGPIGLPVGVAELIENRAAVRCKLRIECTRQLGDVDERHGSARLSAGRQP